jgi:hypothetical protein
VHGVWTRTCCGSPLPISFGPTGRRRHVCQGFKASSAYPAEVLHRELYRGILIEACVIHGVALERPTSVALSKMAGPRSRAEPSTPSTSAAAQAPDSAIRKSTRRPGGAAPPSLACPPRVIRWRLRSFTGGRSSGCGYSCMHRIEPPSSHRCMHDPSERRRPEETRMEKAELEALGGRQPAG